MKARAWAFFLGFLVFLLMPGVASAQVPINLSTVCAAPTRILADGQLYTGTLGPGVQLFFDFSGRAGHSYSFEIFTTDGSGQPNDVVFFDTDDGCGAGTSLAQQATTTTIPALETFDGSLGFRRSFIALNNGTYRVLVDHQFDGIAHPVIFSLTETSLLSPAWSTFGTFETFYSIVNTTQDGTLDAHLTLKNTAGVAVATFDFLNVPPGGVVSTNTAALGVANNLNGSAIISHNGPADAFVVEAAIANFAVTPNIIQPVSVQRLRQAPH